MSRWSLAHRVALATGGLAFLVVAIGGGASYYAMRQLIERHVAHSLEHNGDMFARQVKTGMQAVWEAAAALAGNTLVGNALVDNVGRELYLPGFLADFSQVQGIPVRLALTDFRGRFIGGDASVVTAVGSDWAADVVTQGQAAVRLLEPREGSRPLMLGVPVIFANTGLPEGALLLLVDLDWLLGHEQEHLLLADPSMDGAAVINATLLFTPATAPLASPGPAGPAGRIALRRTVDVPDVFSTYRVEVELEVDQDVVNAPLTRLLELYLLLGLALIPLLIFASRLVARSLTRGLREMETAAQQITRDRIFASRLPVTDQGEIGSLGRSFNRVLETLEQAYRELELNEHRLMDALEAVHRNKARLVQHIEVTPVGVVEWDGSLRVESWNPAAERIFGYTEAAARGRTAAELILPAGREEVWGEVAGQVLKGEEVGGRTFENLRANGESVDCEWFHSPLRGPDGRIIGIASLVQDLSERRRAEIAEATSRAKSSFLANISHELRTPLNVVMGYAQVLERDATLGESQLESVRSIHRAGEHLLNLINDILDLTKIEAGRFVLNPTNTRLKPFFNGLTEMFAMVARRQGLEFRYEQRQSLPRVVHIDERRMRQVLINLLGNAVKFTERGHVTLRTGYREGQLEVEVEDSGVGIPEADRQAIFQPFHQVGEERFRIQGTGLGLAISRRLVELMEGTLEVESGLDQGSLFRLTIPLPEIDQESLPPVPDHLRFLTRVTGYRWSGSPQQVRVIVIDDIEDNRKVLVDLLGPLGFEVRAVADGESGLEMACQWRPELVLMDLRMPRMGGVETTRKIRATAECEGMVIIAVSASAYGQDRELALEAGCNDHLPKPVQREHLLDSIGRHLGLEWEAAEAETGQEEAIEVEEQEALSDEMLVTLSELIHAGRITEILSMLGALSHEHSGRDVAELLMAAKRFDLKQLKQRCQEAMRRRGLDGGGALE